MSSARFSLMGRAALIATCAALLGAPGPARADLAPSPSLAAPSVEVLVLAASSGPGGIDPSLAGLPQLSRPPFNGFSRIAVVSRTTVSVPAQGTSVNFDGGTVSLRPAGNAASGRASFATTIVLNGRTTTLTFAASRGEPFFTVRAAGNGATIFGFIIH